MISLHLFGKPGWELDEGSSLTGDDLRAFADSLKERLDLSADFIDKLTQDGWSAEVGLYDLYFNKDNVENVEEYLTNLGVNPEYFLVEEDQCED